MAFTRFKGISVRETVFIHLPANFEQLSTELLECNAVWQNSAGGFSAPRLLKLAEVNAIADIDSKRARIVLILPASSATIFNATIPKQMLRGGAARWQRAVIFSLEDQVAEDLDKLHFAIAPREGIQRNLSENEAMVPVATMRNSSLEALTEHLSQADLNAEFWALDTLLIPMPASGDGMGVLISDNEALVRTNDWAGFKCPLSMLPALVQRHAAETGENAKLQIQCHCLGLPQEQVDALRETLTDAGHKVIMHNPPGNQSSDLVKVLAQQFSVRGFNLRQGQHAAQQAYRHLLKPWRWVAVAAVALLLVEFVSGSWEVRRNNNAVAQIKQQITNVFQSALPEVRRIQNPSVQMRQAIAKLESNASETGFIELLAIIAPAVNALPDVSIETLAFRNNVVELRLKAASVNTVDLFKKRFDPLTTINYEIASVNAVGDNVDIRVTITPRESAS